MQTRSHHLIEIAWPEFGEAAPPPEPPAAEFERRLALTRTAMERRAWTHLVVYGDREHFANLAWLTQMDPRFEEMLLVIGPASRPLLIVGNECEGYLPFSPLHRAGGLRAERFLAFSLLNQPREGSRTLREILASEGIGAGSQVGCAGWKYFSSTDDPAGPLALDVPSFIADALRELAGRERVENASDLFMHPEWGLRATVSASEIAEFEYSNIKASEAVKRMIFGVRPGRRDHDVVRLAQWDGEPLGCHATFASGDMPGLCSPRGRTLQRGEPLSLNLCSISRVLRALPGPADLHGRDPRPGIARGGAALVQHSGHRATVLPPTQPGVRVGQVTMLSHPSLRGSRAHGDPASHANRPRIGCRRKANPRGLARITSRSEAPISTITYSSMTSNPTPGIWRELLRESLQVAMGERD